MHILIIRFLFWTWLIYFSQIPILSFYLWLISIVKTSISSKAVWNYEKKYEKQKTGKKEIKTEKIDVQRDKVIFGTYVQKISSQKKRIRPLSLLAPEKYTFPYMYIFVFCRLTDRPTVKRKYMLTNRSNQINNQYIKRIRPLSISSW